MSRKRNTGIWLLTFAACTGLLLVAGVAWLALRDPAASSPGLDAPVSASPGPHRDLATEAQRDTVRRTLAPDSILAMCLDRFKRSMGRYPHALGELVEKPTTLALDERWAGPYVNNTDLLIDPWGQPYRYRAPGEHNPQKYDLWSAGPDTQGNTDDDLGNW